MRGDGKTRVKLHWWWLKGLGRVSAFMIVRFEELPWAFLRKTRVKLTAPPQIGRLVVGVIQLASGHLAWLAPWCSSILGTTRIRCMNEKLQKACYLHALSGKVDPLPEPFHLGSEDETFSFEYNLGLG